MNRREFVMNLSTAAAATLAALATPLRLISGSPAKVAPAKIAKRSTNSDADLKRLLDSLPCRCLEKFVLTWNAAYPRVEEIEHRLADARRWVSPSGDKDWEKERVATIERELANAERFRIEHPDRYTVGLGRRIDVEVTRRHSDGNDAEWRLLEWLFNSWAFEWVEYVGDHGSVYLFDDWATWAHNGLRCAEIASHADLIEVIADLAAMRSKLRDEKRRRTIPEISDRAYAAMDRSGFNAAFDAVFDEASVLDDMTEAVLDLLWDIVAECVTASGVQDFDPVVESLRLSAIELVGELNAEEGEEEEEDEEASVAA
jgi:hypothetical protein